MRSDDDERRIVRETEFPVGTLVKMGVARQGHWHGAVIDVDRTNKAFPFKIWYGPDPDDWVRVADTEFTNIKEMDRTLRDQGTNTHVIGEPRT